VIVLGVLFHLSAADSPPPTPTEKEPIRATYDAKRAGDFLDSVGTAWTKDRNCITCHTNLPVLMARPTSEKEQRPSQAIRDFLEREVASWERGTKPRGDTYVVATAVGLALDDAHRGTLSDSARLALNRMVKLQRQTGDWNWLKCDWPPLEHDDYYGATLAAVGLGYAPGDYAKSPTGAEGVTRLKAYFTATPAPDLHHQAMKLWASTKLPELMPEPERKDTIKKLLALQRTDGGWSLPSLGQYQRRDKTPNKPDAASDGYGTGFVCFVLQAAGPKDATKAVDRGLGWLQANQRESGRWYTRSLNNDKQHYISNAGSAFALLALTRPKGTPTD
jgi:squalene-hopene/tetraprenyl-beta-curcumene cyclase